MDTSLMEINRGETSYLLGSRERHQRSNRITAPCVATGAARTDREEKPVGQIVTINRTADESEFRDKKKERDQERISVKRFDGLERIERLL